MLDDKMNWGAYIEIWYLNPRVTLWLYTVAIRPFLLFSFLVWLEQVQKLPCIDTTGTMATFLIAAILNLPSLHILVEAKAKRASYKIYYNEWWFGRSHYP